MPYAFSDFERDVLADDFISSGTTITAKWKGFVSSGIVVEQAGKTFLNVPELRARCESKPWRVSA